MSENITIRTIEEVTAVLEEQELTKEELLTYLRQEMEIRAFEDNIANLLSKAVLKGASHLYAGQEAVAVGSIACLEERDVIASTHRGHGHCGAMGNFHAKKAGEKARQEHWNKMMAELMGKATGYCRGRGGSMHIADVEKGNMGSTGIVGGNIPVGTGGATARPSLRPRPIAGSAIPSATSASIARRKKRRSGSPSARLSASGRSSRTMDSPRKTWIRSGTRLSRP